MILKQKPKASYLGVLPCIQQELSMSVTMIVPAVPVVIDLALVRARVEPAINEDVVIVSGGVN